MRHPCNSPLSRAAFALLPLTLLSARPAPAADPPVIFYTHKGAESLYRAARYADAESMCKQAVAGIEKARGPKSPELAPPLIDLATICMRLSRFADARAAIDRAESVLDPAVPEQALLIGRLGINKGWRLYSLNEPDAARKVFEDSRAIIEKNQKGESVDLAEIINNLALMYDESASESGDQARSEEARRMLFQAWEMRQRLTGTESPETAESLNNIGMHLLFNPRNRDDIDAAMKTLRTSLEVAVKVYTEDNPEAAMSHSNLALALYAQGDADAAEKELRKAMPVTLRFLGPRSQDRASQLITMGRILQDQTHYDEAEKAFVEAAAINEKIFGKSDPSVVSVLEYLQKLYEFSGDTSKQGEIQRRIEKISGKGL